MGYYNEYHRPISGFDRPIFDRLYVRCKGSGILFRASEPDHLEQLIPSYGEDRFPPLLEVAFRRVHSNLPSDRPCFSRTVSEQYAGRPSSSEGYL